VPVNRGKNRVRILKLMVLAFVMASSTATAGGGPLGIDHLVRYDNSGIWKKSNQNILFYGTVLTVGSGALWLGDQNQLGDTFWRSADSMVLTAVTTQSLKWVFQRERPSQTNNPNKFFQGWGAHSFPSNEVGAISAAVTPFIATYGRDNPSVYLLALLPAYDAVARVKTHGHWQSDVLVGAATGTGIGLWSTHRNSPWTLSLLPSGFQLGYSRHFD
jgi:membrane-associated phospholipid phosphatase